MARDRLPMEHTTSKGYDPVFYVYDLPLRISEVLRKRLEDIAPPTYVFI